MLGVFKFQTKASYLACAPQTLSESPLLYRHVSFHNKHDLSVETMVASVLLGARSTAEALRGQAGGYWHLRLPNGLLKTTFTLLHTTGAKMHSLPV